METAPTLQPTEAFADWAATVPSAWSPAARDLARDAAIDTFGCMIAGATEASPDSVMRAVALWGEGPCTVIGRPTALPAPWAAMVNGTAAHALDFDDNHDPSKTHPSAVLLPAILAVAEPRGLSGAAVIDSYLVGLQILTKVGQGMNPFHRSRGWHATATIGALGAAAASGRVLGLSRRAMRDALSLAASMAGGSMVQFGSMAKSWHAGLAASHGVQAASLAAAGLAAAPEALEGPHGLAQLTIGPDLADLRARTDLAGEHGQTLRFDPQHVGTPPALETYGLKVKRFPNCGSVHRALDGLLELRETHGLTPDNVARIDVAAPKAHLANLPFTRPNNVREARFSLEYCLAAGLVSGGNTLADFTEEAIGRSVLQPIIAKIFRIAIDGLESANPTRVTITMTNGAQISTAIHMPAGSKNKPLTTGQLRAKFLDCSTPSLGSAAAAAVYDRLLDLNGLANLASLLQDLRTGRAGARLRSAG
jgi:2-methylcitrate dehydratase PrpD